MRQLVRAAIGDAEQRGREAIWAAARAYLCDEVILRLPHLGRRWLASWLGRERLEWHSYDGHPWRHPWLTSANLRAMRRYSEQLWADVERAAACRDHSRLRIGFVGNLANTLYVRRAPLAQVGMKITQFLHPQDDYAMSHPAWEEMDASIEIEPLTMTALRAAGIPLPEVPDVVRLAEDAHSARILTALCNGPSRQARGALAEVPGVGAARLMRYQPFLSAWPTIERLRDCDVLLATQTPYLAFLSGQPYLAAQNGSDLWFDASRDDRLGRLQRHAFARARVLIVSNPWTFAHARRFGLVNAVYLPVVLDEERYAPGPARLREDWQRQRGGEFFVLVTARLDRAVKGSDRALAGILGFLATEPRARLVVVGWGRDRRELLAELASNGLGDRLIALAPCGKRRLLDVVRSADCVVDQLQVGYYGASALEAFACAKPVVMHLERGQYDALTLGGAPPACEAREGEQVRAQLTRLASDVGVGLALGQSGRTWFLANHAGKVWAPRYRDLFTAIAGGWRTSFADSPLAAPLSREERCYHDAGLRQAPPFPRYEVGR